MQMQQSKIHHSKGFALITVMIMSFLGSLVVFGTMQENINQERMSGNDIKELNANLQAENGMAASYNIIKANSGLSRAQLIALLPNVTTTSGGYQRTVSDRSASDTSLDAEDLGLSSNGSHYEANDNILGTFTIDASSGESVFPGSIVTCDGANLGGSGKIDSYDSSAGAYDANNPGNNGDLYVLNPNASGLELSGSSPIKGNASINGDVTFNGSASISGDAHVSGNIDLGSSGSVAGSIRATGNVRNSYSQTISQSITANGDVTIRAGYPNNIIYGGNLVYPNYGEVPFANQSSDQVTAVASQDCDILDIESEFDNTTDGVGSIVNPGTTLDFQGSSQDATFSSSGIDIDGTIVSTIPSIIEFLGEYVAVYVLEIDTFSNGSTITIESGNDVTIYLSDAVSIEDKVYIEDGATLTIITESDFTLSADGGFYPLNSDGTASTSALNSSGETSVILYSGYESSNNSDYGITLRGNTDMFFTAYAPMTSINVTAGGNIFGSLRSDYLNVTGGAGIHFDEKIKDAELASTVGATGPVIKRWF